MAPHAAAPAAEQAWPRRVAGTALAATLGWLLLGDLGIAIRDRVAQPGALELLRQHGASDTTTSLLLATVPALISLLLVPMLGWYSDHHRSRWGRRRPFLFAAALAGCGALLGLAAAPDLAGWIDTVLGAASPGVRNCTLGCFCLFWTVFECAALTAVSMFTGLVSDIVPPALLGRFYAAIRIVGLSVGIAFNTWVFALTEHHLRQVLLGAALAFAVPVLLLCVSIREPAGATQKILTRRRGRLRDCAAHPSFPLAIAMFVLAGVTFAPFNTFYQHYAHDAGVPKATLGALTATGYAISIASAFGIGWLVDRRGAVRVSCAIMALYCVIAALGCVLVKGPASFQLFYLAHVSISGAWFTAASSLPMVLFPADRFVQFNASKDMLVVLANIVVSAVQGPLLDLSGHAYRLTLLSATVGSLLCVGCMLRLRRSDPPTTPVP